MNRDPLETVSVSFDGGSFSGWSRVSIEYSVDQAARTASLTCSDLNGALPLRPGMNCTIAASGTTIITGYIRDVEPSYDAEHHSVEVSIVSRTIDAVEASIDHPTGYVENKSLDDIARAFDTYGVGIVAKSSFPIEKYSGVNPGASLFYHIEPLARSHQALIYDNEQGQLVLAVEPPGHHGGSLQQGRNIYAANGILSEKDRFSETIARGQSSKGKGKNALHPEARAADGAVRRTRKKIIVLETDTTSKKLEDRVKREARRAAGYSTRADVQAVGWRADDGMIFQPHWTIALVSPRIYINQVMAIESVTLVQEIPDEPSEQPATYAELSLVEPSALNGQGGAGSGSSDAWKGVDPKTSYSPGG